MMRGQRLRSTPLEVRWAALRNQGEIGRPLPTSGPPIPERAEKSLRTEVPRRRTGARFHKASEAKNRHDAAPKTKPLVGNTVHFSCTGTLHPKAEHGLEATRHRIERVDLSKVDLRPEAITQQRSQLHSRNLAARSN